MQRRHPDVPVLAISTMSEVIDSRLMSERLLAVLGTFFAIVALTLAAVGVFGLQAHAVARRIPEFGVRLALGARPSQMLWMTVRDNVQLAMMGAAIGMVAALASLRVLDGLLFGLSATDTVNLVTAAAVRVVVSLGAAIVPGRRAASVDPLTALRAE